jgi:hypothetical protein
MSKGAKAPAPPDPTQVAAAQQQSNVQTAAAQAALNNVNSVTPFGSTQYIGTGSYNAGGNVVPTYTQYTNLTPLGQQILDQQMGLQQNQIGFLNNELNVQNSLMPAARNLAQQGINSSATPLNISNTPYASTLNKGPQLLDNNTVNAIYGQQKGFLDPQWNLQSQQLQDQLARQGIGVGSAAYNSAMQNFNNSKTQAYQSAQDSAISGGSAAASNLFNMALAGQNQNVQQQVLAQEEPYQILQGMFGIAQQNPVQTPTQPISQAPQTSISPTDVTGAYALSQQAAQAQYQAQLQQQNSLFGGLASLGSAGLMGWMLG